MRLASDQQATLRIVFVVDESYVYHGGPGYDYLAYIASCREEGQSILDTAKQLIKSHSFERWQEGDSKAAIKAILCPT